MNPKSEKTGGSFFWAISSFQLFCGYAPGLALPRPAGQWPQPDRVRNGGRPSIPCPGQPPRELHGPESPCNDPIPRRFNVFCSSGGRSQTRWTR